jgi:ABC-type glutathione transport system ATPase component
MVFSVSDLSVRTERTLVSRPRTILSGVSVSLGAGEVLAILGKSGAGKTVLWHAMFGLGSAGLAATWRSRTPSLPEARFEAWRRSSVAFVQQGGHRCLDPRLTLEDYLRRLFTPQQLRGARQAFLEAIAALGLRLNERDLGRSAGSFSGGEAQRLALALRLAAKPKLMVLDEPSAALDFDSAQRMKALVAEMVKVFRVAVICVTHDYHFIAGLARTALYLDRGKATELDLDGGQGESEEARDWLTVSRREAAEYARFFGNGATGAPANLATVQIRMSTAGPAHAR